MDYEAAVAAAPNGWRHFDRRDIERLPNAIRRQALRGVPDDELQRMKDGDAPAAERVVRALFWTLVYHLEPGRWDELARAEPVAPALLDALPRVDRAVDVGAGSGRLTAHLVRRAGAVVAVEPAIGLLSMLRERLPGVQAVSGFAEALPVRDGWSQLTAACGAFGPDPAVLSELKRVTCRGGVVALVNPEQPEWFEAHGWERRDVAPATVETHERWIDEFFGPPDPPRVLVTRRRIMRAT